MESFTREDDYITYAHAARILNTTTDEIKHLVNNGDITIVIFLERPHIVRQTLQTYLSRSGGPLSAAMGDDPITFAMEKRKGR
jgi:hypothetical protein